MAVDEKTMFNGDRDMLRNKSLKTAWGAAHRSKVKRGDEINVPEICSVIGRKMRRGRHPSNRLSLRSSSVLLSGAVRLHSYEVDRLLRDTEELLSRVNQFVTTTDQTHHDTDQIHSGSSREESVCSVVDLNIDKTTGNNISTKSNSTESNAKSLDFDFLQGTLFAAYCGKQTNTDKEQKGSSREESVCSVVDLNIDKTTGNNISTESNSTESNAKSLDFDFLQGTLFAAYCGKQTNTDKEQKGSSREESVCSVVDLNIDKTTGNNISTESNSTESNAKSLDFDFLQGTLFAAYCGKQTNTDKEQKGSSREEPCTPGGIIDLTTGSSDGVIDFTTDNESTDSFDIDFLLGNADICAVYCGKLTNTASPNCIKLSEKKEKNQTSSR